MGRWYLVRHGETAWNADNRVQGQTDVPLHDIGRREALLTGDRLSGIRFAAAYASDLSRTTETATIILARQADAAPMLVTDSTLREVSFGAYEGLRWDEIRDVDTRMADREVARDLDFAPPNGESFRQVLARVDPFVRTLHGTHGNDDVLVVGHGGTLRALAVALLGLPGESVWQLRGLRSGSISILLNDGRWTALTAWNDSGHLVTPTA